MEPTAWAGVYDIYGDPAKRGTTRTAQLLCCHLLAVLSAQFC